LARPKIINKREKRSLFWDKTNKINQIEKIILISLIKPHPARGTEGA